MNLCASWYPVLIVDEGSSFSPPSLLAFRVGAGVGCTDKEEPEEEALFFFFDCFFNFLGVVTSADLDLDFDFDLDFDSEWACPDGPPPGREEELELGVEEEVDDDEVVGEETEDLDEEGE